MKENTTKPTNPPDNNEEMETDAENDQEQEFETLNTQIDQLNTVLDVLEKKNDDIKAQLEELLKSSREARTRQQPIQEKPSASKLARDKRINAFYKMNQNIWS